eukprot:3889952-Pleurochrysis_carterae.AAC.3
MQVVAMLYAHGEDDRWQQAKPLSPKFNCDIDLDKVLSNHARRLRPVLERCRFNYKNSSSAAQGYMLKVAFGVRVLAELLVEPRIVNPLAAWHVEHARSGADDLAVTLDVLRRHASWDGTLVLTVD